MPSPTASLATLRPDLAGSMEEFDLAMSRQGFIGLQVAPVLEVAQQAGTFGKIPVEQLLVDAETGRAPGAGYGRGGTKFTPATYATQEHGREEEVDYREAKMYANYIDAEMVATQRARDIILRNHEKRIADLIFNATTWTSFTTGVTTEWSNATNATPRANVKAAKQAVRSQCGLEANALIICQTVFENLLDSAEILDRLKYAGFTDPRPGRINAEAIAQALGIDRVIVANAIRNSAKEGQSASLGQVWDDEYAMVCRIAETADHREPCLARTFHWGEDGSEIGGTVESYYEEKIRADVIRCRHDTDELVMYVEAGHLLSNITA